ncbi:MAG: hypothetical protein ACRCZB_07150 [Bacteroidales bacterium]
MGMTVKRSRDTQTARVFMHKLADIRGGVSVKTSVLGDDYIKEGAVLSTPTDGVCNIVKFAKVLEAVTATGTEIKVEKGGHFKVGQFVMSAVGAKAYAITEIDKSNKSYDVIKVGTTLGAAIAVGGYLIEAAAQSTSTGSALKYTPQSVAGTGKVFAQGDNIDTDAWLIGVTKGNDMPAFIAAYLTGIINY